LIQSATDRPVPPDIPGRRRATAGWPVSLTIATGFTAFFAWVQHLRNLQYAAAAFDLGLLTQVTWNNLQGNWFATSLLPFNYLAEHLSPALLFLAPVFLIWPNTEVLLLVQAVAIGMAGVGIFLATRQCTGDWVSAVLVQGAYYLAPPTGWVLIDEFHPVSLAVPAIAFATWLLWRKKLALATVVALVALLASEDAALWVAPFGILTAVVGRRQGWRWGVAGTIVALAWLVGYLLIVVPAVRPSSLGGTAPHPDLGSFSWCGNSFSAIESCLVRDPVATIRRAFTPNDIAALASVLVPTGGLALFGPSFLISWPRWLVLLLGNDPPGYHGHYIAIMVPAAFLGAAEAIGYLERRDRRLARSLAVLVIGGSLVAYVLGSPLPGGRAFVAQIRPRQTVAAIDAGLRLIPPDPRLAVAATSAILPHVALRPNVYLVTDGAGRPADYRIFDQADPYPLSHDDLQHYLALVRVDPNYLPIFHASGVIVFERQLTLPDRSMNQSFSDIMTLVGYSIGSKNGNAAVRLYWRLDRPAPVNYHFFIHLDANAGAGYSQADGELAKGNLPTTHLKVGQIVANRVSLPAPQPSAWGQYYVDIGWYDLQTGVRLKLADGNDHLTVGLLPTH
jgi:uncharacterized membrane protein